jgi:aspartate aminotransferase-like enzyme
MSPSHLLMIPGPTPLPDEVRSALGQPAMGHRSPEFKAILEDVLPSLQWAFKTIHPVLLYTASGTGAMEASLINTLNPGDRVLALCCGIFSNRWAEIANLIGLDVTRITVPEGQANTVDSLQLALDEDATKPPSQRYKAVMLTHSETSTGVLNPLKALATLIKAHGALSIVDAVTSLGAADFAMDDWGIDLAVSGSQKGFMLPPGLSFLAVGPKAWEAHQQCKNPGYYFNFSKTQKAQALFTTPYTPSTPLIVSLQVALTLMKAEGLPAIIARHAHLQRLVRSGLIQMGFNLMVPNDHIASPSVTSVYPLPHLSAPDLRTQIKQRFSITLADGQGPLKGKIFRVGHLGYVSERDVVTTLGAIKHVALV